MGLLVPSIHRDMRVCTHGKAGPEGPGKPWQPSAASLPSFPGWSGHGHGTVGWGGVINTEHRNTWPQLSVCSLQPSQRAWEGLSGSESDGYEGP